MGFRADPRTYGQVINHQMNKMKPGDFFLVNNPTGVNAFIRYVSNIPYGHAILYLGKIGHERHSCLQQPMRAGLQHLSYFLKEDNSTGILFVHCRHLSDETRFRIKLAALAYYETQKRRGGVSMDGLTMALQGFSTFFTRGARMAVGAALDNKDILLDQGSADTQLERATADHAAVEFLGTSISGWRKIYNNIRDRKDIPLLTCASLVTWTHDQGGHKLLKEYSLNPEIAQPQQLYTRVIASKGSFECSSVGFGHADETNPRRLR